MQEEQKKKKKEENEDKGAKFVGRVKGRCLFLKKRGLFLELFILFKTFQDWT